LRWLLATAGEPVARFAGAQPSEAVVVYRWLPQRLPLPSITCVTAR
jgi:hypothetical protein